MILDARQIAKELESPRENDPFVLAPRPNINEVKDSGAASVDLRLGTWFLATKASRHTVLDIYKTEKDIPKERDIMHRTYIPLGGKFILHPRSFVLASTLEWMRMPRRFAGYVTGRSSWGRRGLVIETAPGVHPGFSGCLTLELANVGEIPIALMPGTAICQLFTHNVGGNHDRGDKSGFVGHRQPRLGKITAGDFLKPFIT